MRFIGDVHGKFDQYSQITGQVPKSIQVGDMGIGFGEVTFSQSFTHRFIRGNHDDPVALKSGSFYPNYIPDGHFEDGMFFMGGGESIDRHFRTEGVDWWPEEQLSSAELYDMVDKYEAAKPRILVCHECPADVVIDLFDAPGKKWMQPSRTSHALNGMLAVHQPEIVIFGHWHQDRDQVIRGTRFICLGELSFIDLDM